jgi:hypothetical protein
MYPFDATRTRQRRAGFGRDRSGAGQAGDHSGAQWSDRPARVPTLHLTDKWRGPTVHLTV